MTDLNTDAVSAPIKDLATALNWKPPASSWASKVVPRVKRSTVCCKDGISCNPQVPVAVESRPKTLVCHDMAGGYLEDRFVDGVFHESDSGDYYNIVRWSGIDIFVYFSHHFITIPPCSWTNAAHKNGVTVLGTIITEGHKGAAMCAEFLQNDSTIDTFSTKLAQICDYYKFSGYLLNIENPIFPQHKDNLFAFIMALRQKLKDINSENLVIWYDSVSEITGRLNWQNELNDHNRTFFLLCDGIFLNYNWNEKGLKSSGEVAQERRVDVYVGVDVHGRGCYGGGGFNSNLALQVIRNCGLSAALFAPGWVFENKKVTESFLERDHLFWAKLHEHLYLTGPTTLPFTTSFSTGSGHKLFRNGQVIRRGKWFDLSQQDFLCPDFVGCSGMGCCASYVYEEAYNGGSCLALTSTEPQHSHRILICEFDVTAEDKFTVDLTCKLNSKTEGDFDVVSSIVTPDGVEKKMLTCKDKTELSEVWTKRTYELDSVDGKIIEISCKLNLKLSSVLLLGELTVTKKENKQII